MVQDENEQPAADGIPRHSLETLFAGSVFAGPRVLSVRRDTLAANPERLDRFLQVGRAFLRLVHAAGVDVRARRNSRLNADPSREHVGELLLLTLEQLSDQHKLWMLVCLFEAYLDEKIGCTALRLLLRAVNLAFYDDLTAFLRHDAAQGDCAALMQSLSFIGLTQRSSPHDEEPAYDPTVLGHQLRDLLLAVGCSKARCEEEPE